MPLSLPAIGVHFLLHKAAGGLHPLYPSTSFCLPLSPTAAVSSSSSSNNNLRLIFSSPAPFAPNTLVVARPGLSQACCRSQEDTICCREVSRVKFHSGGGGAGREDGVVLRGVILQPGKASISAGPSLSEPQPVWPGSAAADRLPLCAPFRALR